MEKKKILSKRWDYKAKELNSTSEKCEPIVRLYMGALIELLDPLCRFKIHAAIYGLNFNVHEAITGVKRMSRKRKEAKLYIPSTLNTDLIFWHPQCIGDAVKH